MHVLALGIVGIAGCAEASSDAVNLTDSTSEAVVAADTAATTLPDNIEDLVLWKPGGRPAEPLPDEVLSSYYDCLVENDLADANPTQPVPGEDAGLSDCAVASGVDEYGDIYRPLTESDIEALTIEADLEYIPCLEDLGFEVPTVQGRFNDGVLIDWDALTAKYPNIDQDGASCAEHPEGNG